MTIDYLSHGTIECGLWAIQRYAMHHYGIDQADRDTYPLRWYVNTGRASAEFLRLLFHAKPFMVARLLHKGGSHDEALRRVMEYIGYAPA